MLAAIIFIAIGIIIGWNIPQPPWAKDLQDKAVTAIRNLIDKSGNRS